MKLIKEQEIFYVACSTNDFGFKFDDTYEFLSMEEVEKFLGMKNDYKNQVYYHGVDRYGVERSLGCNEFPEAIYSCTEYEIDWSDEKQFMIQNVTTTITYIQKMIFIHVEL